MSLRMLPGDSSKPEPSESAQHDGPRPLAPGAPPSPGPMPLALAEHLRMGEAVIWWGAKDELDSRALGLVVAVLVVVLGFATALAPEFWVQPWEALWRPLLALLSPVLFLLFREWINLRATIVTDTSVIDVPRRGNADRLAFDNVRRVRRDLVRGGIRLDGVRHRVRIPPTLAEPARTAIETQRVHQLRPVTGTEIDDPGQWMP